METGSCAQLRGERRWNCLEKAKQEKTLEEKVAEKIFNWLGLINAVKGRRVS